MENLLKPDIGLMFWTVITFLIMVLILKKVAWGPLLKVIDDREAAVKLEMEITQKNKEEMEQLKSEYERQLSSIENRAKELLAQAEHKGQAARDAILKETEDQARKLMQKTREQLDLEKQKLIQELRSQVAHLSILGTEKLLRQSVDKKVQEKFVQDFIESLKK